MLIFVNTFLTGRFTHLPLLKSIPEIFERKVLVAARQHYTFV